MIAVEVDDEGAVIFGAVIRPWAGCAIVRAARRQSRAVKRFDGVPVLSRKTDMGPIAETSLPGAG